MGGESLDSEPGLSELHERLEAGIETCRSVIANYRSLLTDVQSAPETAGAESDGADGLPEPKAVPASK
jgi:hypothetical protein